jgi:hypothetical membrane protein
VSTLRQRVPRIAALVVVCVLCMWPTDGSVPTPGLDRAWSVGLSLARVDGLQFGNDLVFTYGPLGHGYFPSSVSRSGLLISVIVIATLCTVVIALSYRLLRLTNGRRIALFGAGFLVLLGPSSGAALGDVAVFAVYATMIDAVARRRNIATWWFPALGSASAALLLGKVSTGIITAAGVAVFAAALPGRLRHLGLAAAGFVATLVALWVGTGQSLGGLPAWLRGALEISDGYSSAMGRREAGRGWELLVVWIVVLSLLVVGVRYVLRWRRQSPDTRLPLWSVVGVALLGLGLFEFSFKEGFVRHDIHSGIFFFALVYVVTVLPTWQRPANDVWPAAVGWLATVLFLFTSGGVTVSAALDPAPSARAFARVVNHFVDADEWRNDLDAGRAAARNAYQVPPDIVEAMQGRTVHVDPYDLVVTWAYDVPWNPTPVFQRYSAYTDHLDQLNADHLTAGDGPELVLRSTDAPLDGRFDFMEAPRMMRAMLCRYEPAITGDRWQLLQRADDRCEVESTTAEQRVAAGESVELPPYDPATQAVLVAAEFDTSVFDFVRTTLYKSEEYFMAVDGQTFRVLPKMTGHPGLLYVPPTSGWADQFRGLLQPPAAISFDHDAVVTFTIVAVAAQP